MEILGKIKSRADIEALSPEDMYRLCAELRDFLIKSVARTGGHLASNLGVVELTVALHRVFDTSRDRLVFDVGHQCYVHKMLTGRLERFDTLRQQGGISGFPKPSESRHDAFIAGHASNSISVALGMARARTLSRRDFSVISLIGDGALTGGLAYEALSDAGASGEPMIIVLNDNGMSITDNVGGVARYLSRQRIKPSYAAFKKRYRRLMEILPGGRKIYRFTHGLKSAFKEALLHCSMFEEMGLQYIGPVDGHDILRLVEAFSWAKRLKEPSLIHVITQKGKGYSFSEQSPEKYHSVPAFDYRTGITADSGKCFSAAFGEELESMASDDPRVCAITASMTEATGLESFSKRFPDRFYDVGIAEGHAVSMAAGMASQGMIPVFAVYSTFLQRSYDMLLHDVAIQNLHTVFAIDRAGLIPGDGETHQGIFDMAYLTSVPDMAVFLPSSYRELRDMLRHAAVSMDGPVAVRYPKGEEGAYRDGGVYRTKIVRTGADFTLVTYGININTALEAADILRKEGISAEIVKLGFAGRTERIPGDITQSLNKTKRLLVLEDCASRGSVGEWISARLARDAEVSGLMSVVLLNVGGRFAPCGSVAELRRLYGLDAAGVCRAVREVMRSGLGAT